MSANPLFLLINRFSCTSVIYRLLGHKCIFRNRKNCFVVFPSHKIIVQKYSVLLETLDTVPLGGVRPSWTHWMCHVEYPYFPPTWLTIWYAGRAIYILSTKEQFISSQCRCLLVLWHTGSHCIILIFIISNFISLLLLTLRESKLNLLGCHYASFLTRSLGFLELFSNSPLRVFGRLSRCPAYFLTSQKQSNLSGLEPDGPPWASLVLSALGHLSRGLDFRLTVSVNFQFIGIVQSLFDYYSIIVCLLFSILILERYSWYVHPVKK
jgi:hypothetical protein